MECSTAGPVDGPRRGRLWGSKSGGLGVRGIQCSGTRLPWGRRLPRRGPAPTRIAASTSLRGPPIRQNRDSP
jgi:hypothetical protein